MAAKDFDWFRATWTKDAQKLMEESDKAQHQTPEFWMALWEKTFKDRSVELTQRVETGDYVIVAFRIIPNPSGSAPEAQGTPTRQGIELHLVLRNEDSTWLATQELADDPVLNYWKTPDKVVKRLVRGVETKEVNVP
jgi:hypothetical protein